MNELLSNFGVDWKLLLAQAVNFGVLLYLLNRFAFGPIITILEKRRTTVEKGLENAAEAERNLRDAHKNSDEIKEAAKVTAEAIVMEAGSAAKAYIAEAKTHGEAEKARIIAHAGDEIESIKKNTEKELKINAVHHVLGSVKAILGEEVTAEMNERIINRFTKTS